MRIVVARCDLVDEVTHRNQDSLVSFLEAKGHSVQPMILPAAGPLPRSLATVASHRLMNLAATADALICLSATAAIPRHPKKIVWLLDPTPITVASAGKPRRLEDLRRDVLDNVLVAALAEATSVFSPSKFAKSRLRDLGLRDTQLLQPAVNSTVFQFGRNPGPELLCLAPLTDWQRPDLLVECLPRLPEPIRARWIGPVGNAELIHRLRAKAMDLGVAHRLTLEVRPIDPHEQAYLLSQAMAYVHLEPDSWLTGDALQSAWRQDVPLIMCRDCGAAVELFSDKFASTLPAADSESLAEVIGEIATMKDEGADKLRLKRKPTRSGAPWAALSKVLAQ
jgi:hypothetical protein